MIKDLWASNLKSKSVYLVLIIMVFCINLPIVNMVGTSLKSPTEILTNNSIIPHEISVASYESVIKRTSFYSYLYNSFIIAVCVTVYTTIVAAMAGYSISRYRRRLRAFNIYSSMLLLLQMFPTVLLLIPLFTIFRNYGITNTRLSVILMYGAFSMPFCIWMLQGFFDGIPIEVEEAGVIDGCSQFQCFCRLILPVSSPGLASVSIFVFIYCWNEYLLASIFLKKEAIRTLPLGLQNFIQQFNTDWGSLMAASTMTMIPVIIFLIFLQKYIVQGLTAGAVKG